MADRGKRVWGIAVLCVALALPLGAEAFLLPAALGFRPALAGVHATTTCMPGSRRPPGHHSMAAGLSMQSRGGGRGGGRGGRGGRGGGPAGAKKSGRMGKMVMQELMAIVRGPVARGCDDEWLRQAMIAKVSVVDVEMSADVRSAKVHISVIGEGKERQQSVVDWMQSNSKSIRYELSQSMKHLRTVPSLRFVSADVGAAMDIMSLLDRISKEKEEGSEDSDDYVPDDESDDDDDDDDDDD